eukprot:1187339-Prorocentrum_minimum.AAC.4
MAAWSPSRGAEKSAPGANGVRGRGIYLHHAPMVRGTGVYTGAGGGGTELAQHTSPPRGACEQKWAL